MPLNTTSCMHLLCIRALCSPLGLYLLHGFSDLPDPPYPQPVPTNTCTLCAVLKWTALVDLSSSMD